MSQTSPHLWHPFTQHKTEAEPPVVTAAKGCTLYGADGKEYLDLIASWWTCIHGHGHPHINAALQAQMERMAHVMFAGFMHPPATNLADKLAALLPGDLNKVFFSDDGSTAVEVGLKMALHTHKNNGEQERTRFLAFDGGYHGDTFGAMSVSQGSGFFGPYKDVMCPVDLLPWPTAWEGDTDVETKEAKALQALDTLLEKEGKNIAALIVEPLLQGASGMRMCRPAFLKTVVQKAKKAGLLVIFDEVAVGFGRLGSMFACEQVGETPDIICLSKGLTAGYLPMSVTVATDDIFNAFLSDSFSTALAHGHTFTANPLACSVALAGLDVFEMENSLEKVAKMETAHHRAAAELSTLPMVKNARVKGSVLAFEIARDDGYKSSASEKLRHWWLENGLNIRPLGNTVYLMPPYCITEDELSTAYTGLTEGLKTCLG